MLLSLTHLTCANLNLVMNAISVVVGTTKAGPQSWTSFTKERTNEWALSPLPSRNLQTVHSPHECHMFLVTDFALHLGKAQRGLFRPRD